MFAFDILSAVQRADVAQLVEQPIRNRQVTSSSLVVGSSINAGSKRIDLGTLHFLSRNFIL
jgi:hypothetical protein